MATSRCTLSRTYASKSGDYIVLPFCNGKTPCFGVKGLPKPLQTVKPPKDPGGALTVYGGQIGRATVLARAVRLDKEHSTPEMEARKAVATALAAARQEKAKRVVVFLAAAHKDLVLAAHEGAVLGGYVFDRYLNKKTKLLPVLLVVSGSLATLRTQAKRAERIHACVNFARDVLNEPANSINPPTLARRFQHFGRDAGLKVTVWDEKRLAKERCGGVLGVGQGASAKPRLVVGEYRPKRFKKHLCLVGKGVTFDTGGYCLKPSAGQVGMKYDMGGAAMMFGAACAIARLKIPIRLTVITPLVENDISATAYHTTDILTTRSGRTVEVGNTDAEGRLILTDALTLAAERKPDWIIDAATLTGACVVALGEDIAGIYGTAPRFTQTLIQSGQSVGEFFWELPLHMPYAEQLKSTIADTSNMGGKWNGSITGAVFLKQWVPDKVDWIHCDIAGPGIKEEPLYHLGKGGKGFGVKSITRLAERLAKR